MPRKAHIDAPGALHHIIVRNIDRCVIFTDDRDRDRFIERLGDTLTDTDTPCYAWALMPNHVSSVAENRIDAVQGHKSYRRGPCPHQFTTHLDGLNLQTLLL